jgi:hypothetical protein
MVSNAIRAARAFAFELEFSDLIEKGALSLGPVRFALVSRGSEYQDEYQDGVLTARVEGSNLKRRFAFACKTNWTPRSRLEAAERLRRSCGPKTLPLLVAPYLSERVLDSLQHENISAIDVCGNGLLIDPPGFFVLRTGAKRQPRLGPAPVRTSIYDPRNVATLVPRVLFCEPVFHTTTKVLDACHERMMARGNEPLPLTLPTVSKALHELDEDLMTERQGRERKLRNPARLLEQLQRSFQLPLATPVLHKSNVATDRLWTILAKLRPSLRFVVTGRGSAARHTNLAGPARVQLYVTDLALAREALEAKPTLAFPNLELTETSDEAPYFDARVEGGVPWSSPLQCYLELTRVGADPRERDVAEKLGAVLLRQASVA